MRENIIRNSPEINYDNDFENMPKPLENQRFKKKLIQSNYVIELFTNFAWRESKNVKAASNEIYITGLWLIVCANWYLWHFSWSCKT